MLHLKTFGGLSVDIDGTSATGAAQRRKTLALLALVAAAGHRGISRDKLIASLWPETDAKRGRDLLKQACYALRRDLRASELFLGSIELRLNPAVISSDVESFACALEQNDASSAVSLYTGPFLDGFYLNGGGEFENWVEMERARLASQCRGALEVLSIETSRRGEPRVAAEWWRRVLELDPLSSHAALGLMTALDDAGELAEALRCGQSYDELVREELGADGPTKVSEWMERHRHAVGNRARPSNQPPAIMESVGDGHPGISTITAVETRQVAPEPAAAPVPDEPLQNGREVVPVPVLLASQPLASRHNRRRVYLGLSSLFLISIGAVIWTPQQPSTVPSASSAPATTMAVLPFAYRGSPEFAYLGDGMVDLLSANFDGAGEIRSVDPHTVFLVAAHAGGNRSEPARARYMATRLGAGSYLVGNVVEAGGRLRISARLYAAHEPGATPVAATMQGAPSQLFQLVDGLTAQLIAGRSGGPREGLTRLAALTTDSLAALKAYLEGERQFRAGRLESSADALQRATRIDSSFALAYYRLATVMWTKRRAVSIEAVDLALRHGNRLRDHDRRLIEALAASLHGRLAEAERIYREIVTRHPDDIEATYQLGDLILHRHSVLGHSWLDAREPFERVLAIDPDHEGALYHLSNIAARERKLGELDSLTNRVLRIVPPQIAWGFRGQRAVAFGDTAEVTRFMAALRQYSDDIAQPTAGFVVFTTGDLVVGRRLWRMFTEPSHSRGIRVLAHVTLAKIELMSGQWSAAKTELEAAKALDSTTALEHRAVMSLWPLLRVPRSELLALRNSLLRRKAVPRPLNESGLTAEHSPAHPYLRLYLLGMLSARLGEHASALQYAAELERRAGLAFAPIFVTDLGTGVRAEVARARGRPAEALATLDSLGFWTQGDLEFTESSPLYGHEYEQFARAELLNSLGRYPEALQSYRAIADELFHSGAPAHLRLAQIYERQGERQEATAHYARFVELWKNCDPKLRPLVEEAKRRMEQ